MDAGDEAVKNKLDQLIEGHHLAAQIAGMGMEVGGTQQMSDAPTFTDTSAVNDVVVMGHPDARQDASLPARLPSRGSSPSGFRTDRPETCTSRRARGTIGRN